MNYQNIKKEKEAKTSLLIKKCKMFFAFSNKQFEENKTELKEGEKYLSIGMGAYLPKGNLKIWEDGMEEINNWGRNEIKKKKLEEQEILYELRNHECFYTGEIDDVLDMFKGTYTDEQIRLVYRKYCKSEFNNN